LGAEVRYNEYGLLLQIMLKQIQMEEWLNYADRIPLAFEKLAKAFSINYPSNASLNWTQDVLYCKFHSYLACQLNQNLI
jgi:hypothetical protein